MEKVLFPPGELLIGASDVYALRHDEAGPIRTLRHAVNGVKEHLDALGGEGALQGIQGGGAQGFLPFALRQEVVDGSDIALGGAGQVGIFGAMAQVLVGVVKRADHANHLVEVAGLIVKYLARPEFAVRNLWCFTGGNFLQVSVKETRLRLVGRLGMAKVVEEVNHPA